MHNSALHVGRANRGVAALPAIDGLDTGSGLRFFAGQATRYLQALQTFAALYHNGLPLADHGPGLAGLKHALHGLAGASVVLGAAALGALAQRAESQLECAADIDQAMLETADVRQVLAALVRSLQDCLHDCLQDSLQDHPPPA